VLLGTAGGVPAGGALHSLAFYGDELPTEQHCARTTPLVVVAGSGKTGTESLSTALALLGLKVAHFDTVRECVPTTRRPETDTCTQITCFGDQKYFQTMQGLYKIPTSEYDTHNWCQFDDYDAIADSPIDNLAPLIYRAHGPGTKVILTRRNVTEWAARRADWLFGFDEMPFAWPFAENLGKAQLVSEVYHKRSKLAVAYAFMAQTALLSSVVAPEDLLVLDLESEGHNPRLLWDRLSAFLGKSTAALDTSAFPHDVPGECRSQFIADCSAAPDHLRRPSCLNPVCDVLVA